MSILNEITSELDWREAEIASMRLLLNRRDLSGKQKQVLLRAAWAMLYSHYEGFCKNCLTLFYGEITRRSLRYSLLPINTQLFALSKHLRELRTLPPDELLFKAKNFITHHLELTATFPDVDTAANLWPNLLIDLMKSADLNTRIVEDHRAKLKTLVSRRNGIAHGEKNLISDLVYYHTYEDAVYDVIYDLTFQIEERLSMPPYGSPGSE
jgi:hypothetical protein